MSFFDDDDEPTQATTAQPRRTSMGRTAPRSGGGGGRPPRSGRDEDQQLLVRRAVAAGIGLVLILIVVFGVKACLDSSNESAMKDYNSQVRTIVENSDNEVTKPFFTALSSGTTGNDLQVQVNEYRLGAQNAVNAAKALDVPGDMERAQQYLVLTLNLRLQALTNIAAQILPATSTKGDPTTAINKIAGQMQAFNASDVIYSQRVQPYMTQAFDDAGIGGQVIAPSRSLNNLGWMAPAFVANALGTSLTASDDGSTGQTIAPGTHGHGLVSVSVGSTTLQPSPDTNRLSATPPVTFSVKFANQGENNESRVTVAVTVTGNGFKTITAQSVVAQTSAGTDAEATVSLATAPPKGKAVKITVQVKPVPGEKNTTNNTGEYDAIFE